MQPTCRTMAMWMRSALLVALAALLVPSRIPAAAQGEPPPETLERGIQRDAPDRSPRVLETRPEGGDGTATILLIPAEADAYIASERANQNFGQDALFLGYNGFGSGFGAQRILIRFDTDAIPDNAVINNAIIRLRLSFSSPSEDVAMATVLRRATEEWGESSVTWNNQPAVDAVVDSLGVSSATQWYEWEVGDLVSGWVNEAYPNHGIEITGDEDREERERAFYAREADTVYDPQLIVDYTVVDDNSPPNVSVNALPDYSRRDFDVTWSGSDVGSAGISHYDVEYRIGDGGWIELLKGVTFTEARFSGGQNGVRYEFRARAVDRAGNAEPFGGTEASTIADTLPPVTRVEMLPDVQGANDFTVSWQADDRGGSGVVYYDVRVRFDGGAWEPWRQTTTLTSATYTATRGDGVYEFEARAVDAIGLVEPFMSSAEAVTMVDREAPFFLARLFLPTGTNVFVVTAR